MSINRRLEQLEKKHLPVPGQIVYAHWHSSRPGIYRVEANGTRPERFMTLQEISESPDIAFTIFLIDTQLEYNDRYPEELRQDREK
jgi:hypothetical protein